MGHVPTETDDGTILFTETSLAPPTNNPTTDLTKALSNSPCKKRLTYGSPRKVFIKVDLSKRDLSPKSANRDLGPSKSTRVKHNHKNPIDKTTEENPNKVIHRMLSDRQTLKSKTKAFHFENDVILPEVLGKINNLHRNAKNPFSGSDGGYLGVDPKPKTPNPDMPKSSPTGNK